MILRHAELGEGALVGALVLGRVVDAPTPTITPWPGMSRGTDWTVPIVPGLVSVIVVPWKSSTVSLFVCTLRMRSS